MYFRSSFFIINFNSSINKVSLSRSLLFIEICYVNSFHLENPAEGSRMPKLVNKKLNLLICFILFVFFLLLFMIFFIPKETSKAYLNYITFLYLIFFFEELILVISVIILKFCLLVKKISKLT